jgi:hypothetical protein
MFSVCKSLYHNILNYSTQNNKSYCTLQFDIKAIKHEYLIRSLKVAYGLKTQEWCLNIVIATYNDQQF